MSVDMEVLAYPDVVVSASGVPECKSFTSNKLSVGYQVSDTVFTCPDAEATDKFHLSSVLELSRLFIILNTIGKAILS